MPLRNYSNLPVICLIQVPVLPSDESRCGGRQTELLPIVGCSLHKGTWQRRQVGLKSSLRSTCAPWGCISPEFAWRCYMS